eukprot:144333-Prymnesium_polylepis.1
MGGHEGARHRYMFRPSAAPWLCAGRKRSVQARARRSPLTASSHCDLVWAARRDASVCAISHMSS